MNIADSAHPFEGKRTQNKSAGLKNDYTKGSNEMQIALQYKIKQEKF